MVLAPGRSPRVVDEHTRQFLSALAEQGVLNAGVDEDTAQSLQLLVDCGFVTVEGIVPNDDTREGSYTPTLTDLTLKRSVPALRRVLSIVSILVLPATNAPGVVIGLALLAVSTLYVTLIAPVSASMSPLIDHPAVMMLALFGWNLLMAVPHEAGHFAVARRAGFAPNAGFGLYLYGPVLYVDLTCLELESKWVRVRADLAGVSVDGWACGVLLVVAWITGEPWLHTLLLSSCMVALANLRPTEKYDGFWALRDILDARGMSATWASPRRLMDFMRNGSPSEKRFSWTLVGIYAIMASWLGVAAPRWVQEGYSELTQRPITVLFASFIALAYAGVIIVSMWIVKQRIKRPLPWGPLHG